MPFRPSLLAFTAVTILAGIGPARAGQYVFTDTAYTACCDQLVSGINDQGKVLGTNDPLTGYFLTFAAKGSTGRAVGAAIKFQASGNLTNSGMTVGTSQINGAAYMFDLAHGKAMPLPTIGTYLLGPAQINASLSVVGTAFNASASVAHGYLYAGGKPSLFDPPGSAYTTPSVINAAGQIGGTYLDAKSAPHGFLDTAGAFTTFAVHGAAALAITAIDSQGRLAGSYRDSANRTHGILFTGSAVSTLDYGGQYSTYPSAFGPGGEVIGTIVGLTGAYPAHGFIYANGAFTLIDNPKASTAYGTSLEAVNAAGVLAGAYFDNNDLGHAFTATYSPATKYRP